MVSLTCWWAVRQWVRPQPAGPLPAAPALGGSGSGLWALALVVAGLMLISLALGLATLLDRSRAQARWLAEGLAPALTFGEARAAQQALSALHHLPEVQQAWLTHSDGRPLARFAAGTAALPAGAAAASAACPLPMVLHLDHLQMGQTVRFLGVPVGSLCLRIDLSGQYRQAALIGASGLLLGGLASLCRRRAGRPRDMSREQ